MHQNALKSIPQKMATFEKCFHRYHITVIWMQNIHAECFDKIDNANFLSPTEFRMVLSTPVHEIMQLCGEKTAITLPRAKRTSTEHYSGRTHGTDKTKQFRVNYKLYYMKIFLRKDIFAKYFDKTFCANFFISVWLPYGIAYSGSRHNRKMLRKDNKDSTNVQDDSYRVL